MKKKSINDLVEVSNQILEAMNEKNNKILKDCIGSIEEVMQLAIIKSNGRPRIVEAIFRETNYISVRILILNEKWNFDFLSSIKKNPPPNLLSRERVVIKKLCVKYLG